ncbi:MAG TPA: hypothetical protein VE133_13110, partial [Candidatus Sulfotelmatobacter sp.]|nr:hypothetical protein [Candidatus Sulfotelmatobacter sp.]
PYSGAEESALIYGVRDDGSCTPGAAVPHDPSEHPKTIRICTVIQAVLHCEKQLVTGGERAVPGFPNALEIG